MPRLVLAFVLLLGGEPDPLVFQGKLTDPEAVEISGLVASRKHRGVFWAHPDSGHPPVLFALRQDGTVLGRFPVDALNLDWEDLAADDSGHLVVGDIGNNTRLLPVRTLYVLDEPDPARPGENPQPVLYSISYRFEPAGAFDAEGLFLSKGEAFLISKTDRDHPAEIYAILLKKPASRIPVRPRRLGVLPGFREPVTCADLSADGRFLAVGTLDVARVYEPDAEAGWRQVREVPFPAREIEGLCWDGPDLLLVEEPGRLWRLPASTLALPRKAP